MIEVSDYCLVQADTPELLKLTVDACLYDGFVLVGGISVTLIRAGFSTIGEKPVMLYTQAIAYPKVDPKAYSRSN